MGQSLIYPALPRRLIHMFDSLLCKAYGVYPFSDDPGIILRVQVSMVRHPIRHQKIQLAPGNRILMLHFWNERLPKLPAAGADLGWAKRFYRSLDGSFEAVGAYLVSQPALQDIAAIGGETVLLPASEGSSTLSFLHRYGFTVFPCKSRLGRFGRFWENLYSWLLLWTYNPNSLHSYSFRRLRRMEFWASRQEFLSRINLPG
jgi:hypothetical protein